MTFQKKARSFGLETAGLLLSRSGLPGGGSLSRSGLGCGRQNGPVAEPLLRLIEKLDHVGGHIVDREAAAGIGAARRLEGGHAVLEGLEPHGLDRAGIRPHLVRHDEGAGLRTVARHEQPRLAAEAPHARLKRLDERFALDVLVDEHADDGEVDGALHRIGGNGLGTAARKRGAAREQKRRQGGSRSAG